VGRDRLERLILQLLLDTCALLWIAGEQPLRREARDELDAAYRAYEPVWVSPISAWEVGILSARGRLALAAPPAKWFRHLLDRAGLDVCPMEPETLADSSFLPGTPPRDPADRIILATAREHQFRVLTRDRLMIAYGQAGHANVIAC
jgi:PIN domain nuclease of toxin-antitoxin system